ncbi:MAG: hypothetical protein ABH845_02890 [Candidatus Omnitrophota bacterium]
MSWRKYRTLFLTAALFVAMGQQLALGADDQGKNIAIVGTEFIQQAKEGDALDFSVTVQNNETTPQGAYPLVVLYHREMKTEVEFYGKAMTISPGETGKMVVSVPKAPVGEHKVIFIVYDAKDQVADRKDETAPLLVEPAE